MAEQSLSYSYEQCALHHQATLNVALEMANAGRRIHDRNQPKNAYNYMIILVFFWCRKEDSNP